MKREHLKKLPEYCIWDFNGTLLDDVATGIEAVNLLLKERGIATIPDREAYRRVFGFPIIEYYRRLGFDFEKESYEVVAPLWVAEYLRRVPDAALYPDVRETLSMLRERGVKQVILSATQRDMLMGQLKQLNIAEYFEEVLGLDNIHASSKLSLAEDWRRRHPVAEVLLIGDTDHDVESAVQLNAQCVLVSRGHQSEERLMALGVPVYPDLSFLRAL